MDTIDELATQLQALRDTVVPLANIARLEEYAFVAAERLSLGVLSQAVNAGLPEPQILRAAAPLLQDWISIAEGYEWPLSTETEAVLAKLEAIGIHLRAGPRKPGRPIAEAPRGAPEFSIFVDESGSAALDEASQPVLCLAGVIVKDEIIPKFEQAAEQLLREHGLPPELEFHASEFLGAHQDGPLARLDIEQRFRLLRDFLALGMQHVHGLHHFGMLKSMVKPAFRQKMLAQGLNPYTHTVVWFVVTLDRACLLITMPGRYKYHYDRTDAYRKDIARIFRALAESPNERLRLFGLKGAAPIMIESHRSRFIQLADVAGYYLNRHHQIEIPAFKHRKELEKHKDKIREMYALIRPKVADWLGKDLPITVDWQALADFSLKPQRAAWQPPVRRHRR